MYLGIVLRSFHGDNLPDIADGGSLSKSPRPTHISDAFQLLNNALGIFTGNWFCLVCQPVDHHPCPQRSPNLNEPQPCLQLMPHRWKGQREHAPQTQLGAGPDRGRLLHLPQIWLHVFWAQLAVKVSLKLALFVHADWLCSRVRTVPHSPFPFAIAFPHGVDLVYEQAHFLPIWYLLCSARAIAASSTRQRWVAAVKVDRCLRCTCSKIKRVKLVAAQCY